MGNTVQSSDSTPNGPIQTTPTSPGARELGEPVRRERETIERSPFTSNTVPIEGTTTRIPFQTVSPAQVASELGIQQIDLDVKEGGPFTPNTVTTSIIPDNPYHIDITQRPTGVTVEQLEQKLNSGTLSPEVSGFVSWVLNNEAGQREARVNALFSLGNNQEIPLRSGETLQTDPETTLGYSDLAELPTQSDDASLRFYLNGGRLNPDTDISASDLRTFEHNSGINQIDGEVYRFRQQQELLEQQP